jgi:hypothetical protein
MRRLALLGACVTLAATSVGVFAAPAYADTTSCASGSGTGSISPGLTNTPTPQSISVSGGVTNCVGGGVTSGTLRASLSAPNGMCLASPPNTIDATGTASIIWQDGTGSTGTIKLKSNGITGQEKVKILVTGGSRFVGDVFKTKIAFTPTNPGANCGSIPVTTVSYTDLTPFFVSTT